MAMAHRPIEKPNPRAGKPEPKAEPIRRQARVAIFEDNETVFFGYSEIFKTMVDAHIVSPGPVETVEDALRIFLEMRPDVVITDLSLNEGGSEGFEILRRIKAISPNTPVGLSTSSYHPKKNDEINLEIRKQGFDALFQKADTIRMCEFIEASAPKS